MDCPTLQLGDVIAYQLLGDEVLWSRCGQGRFAVPSPSRFTDIVIFMGNDSFRDNQTAMVSTQEAVVASDGDTDDKAIVT
jgi:hypothetical protein